MPLPNGSWSKLIEKYPELITCCYPDFDLDNFDIPFWMFWKSLMSYNFETFDYEGYVLEHEHSECCNFWRTGTGEWGCQTKNDESGGEYILNVGKCQWYQKDLYL